MTETGARPRQLIAGNWKMNGTRAVGVALAGAIADRVKREPPPCELLLCPPATILMAVGARIGGGAIALGGQDCHTAASGAHTGDIAPGMLADLGCRYVIVGHSERRGDHGETDAMVRAKAAAAIAANLAAIVCVGETQAERDRGEAERVVGRRLAGSLPDDAAPENCVLAYEPVWAIGTGRTATPADIIAMHRFIRDQLHERLGGAGGRVRILYGGSVKAANAAEILGLENVDGALVGGASLEADSFMAIAAAARRA